MDFQFVLAEYAAGYLRSEDAPGVAGGLIDAGHTSANLAELLSLRAPSWREAQELFEAGIRDAGYQIPDLATAHGIIIHRTLHGLAEGRIAPRVGAGRLWELWRQERASDDLVIFVALADEWDEHPRERPAIEQDIRAHAKELEGQYAARSV